MQNSKFKIQNAALIFFILHFAFCIAGCGIPNLEPPECTGARQATSEFYSFHFGNEMRFTPENLRLREKFLTGDFVNNLRNAPPTADGKDPFTLTNDAPKAFRVGKCEPVEPNERVNLGVLLFWKTDARSEQREIRVEAVRENDKWLINKISD